MSFCMSDQWYLINEDNEVYYGEYAVMSLVRSRLSLNLLIAL